MSVPGVSGARVIQLGARGQLEVAARFVAAAYNPDNPFARPGILQQLAHSGNYVAGAFAGDRLVGVAVGWIGSRGRGPLLHSALMAVAAQARDRGVGMRLKQHQRAWALERGIPVIEWTFNPLLARNAFFNFAKLGADAGAYLPDFYDPGEDRILVSWALDSARTQRAGLSSTELAAAGAETVLAVGSDGQPVLGAPTGALMMLCEMPPEDAANCPRWHAACRATVGAALNSGWRITDVTRQGTYILGH